MITHVCKIHVGKKFLIYKISYSFFLCRNNGTCISASTTVNANNESNFRCECVQGYDGVYCELQIDLCGNITCENRGMCETEELMWKCICLDPTLYIDLIVNIKQVN